MPGCKDLTRGNAEGVAAQATQLLCHEAGPQEIDVGHGSETGHRPQLRLELPHLQLQLLQACPVIMQDERRQSAAMASQLLNRGSIDLVPEFYQA